MPIDIVKPLKIERVSSGGSQNDEYPTEMNAIEDYLGAKGIAFKGQDTTTIDVDSNNEIVFKDAINGTKLLSELTGGSSESIPVFTTVALVEAESGADNDLCYIVENDSFYRYESTGSSYIVDHLTILETGDGGNTRWIAVSGKYNYNSQSYYSTITDYAYSPNDTVYPVLDVNKYHSSIIKKYNDSKFIIIRNKDVVNNHVPQTLDYRSLTINYLSYDGSSISFSTDVDLGESRDSNFDFEFNDSNNFLIICTLPSIGVKLYYYNFDGSSITLNSSATNSYSLDNGSSINRIKKIETDKFICTNNTSNSYPGCSVSIVTLSGNTITVNDDTDILYNYDPYYFFDLVNLNSTYSIVVNNNDCYLLSHASTTISVISTTQFTTSNVYDGSLQKINSSQCLYAYRNENNLYYCVLITLESNNTLSFSTITLTGLDTNTYYFNTYNMADENEIMVSYGSDVGKSGFFKITIYGSTLIQSEIKSDLFSNSGENYSPISYMLNLETNKWLINQLKNQDPVTYDYHKFAVQVVAIDFEESSDIYAKKNINNLFSVKQTFVSSNSSNSSINIPLGTDPSAPSNGDVWLNSNGFNFRSDGETIILGEATKLNGYSLNTNDAADNVILEFDATNLELQASNYRIGNLGAGNTQGQQTSLGEKSFVGVDLSDNGQYMLAGDNAGYLWVSSDMGATWTQKSISQNWSGVYVSSTGQYMSAVAGAWTGQAFVGTTSCYIYYSTDYGNNWSISNKTGVMNRICGSADGSKLYATEGNGAGGGSSRSGYVYKSTNYGATWSQLTTAQTKWGAICCNSDGSKILIGDFTSSGSAYISVDSGSNWSIVNGITGGFAGSACSSDFTTLYISTLTQIYKSTDSGSSWNMVFEFSSDYFRDISCSADGKTVFLASNQKLYKSIDSGVTFFEITDFGNKSWIFISTTPNTSVGIMSSYVSYVYIYSPFKYVPISNNTVNTFLNADKVDGADLSTDTTLFNNSDVLIPSQKAIKAYVDARGNPTLNLVYLADRRSAQNLTQNTWTKILWASTQHSNSTYVTYNSSTGEFTAVTGGKYRVYARVAVVNGLTAGTSLVRIEVNKNVTPTGFHEGGYRDKVATNNAGTVYVIIDVTYTVTVNTNDKFCVWVHCDASGSKIWEYYWMNQVIVEKVA